MTPRRSKRQLVVALGLIIVVPATLMVWLAAEIISTDNERSRQALASLIDGELSEVETRVLAVLDRHQQALVDAVDPSAGAEALRAWVDGRPELAQLFVLDRDGRRVFPPAAGPLSADEQAFVQRAQSVIGDPQQLARPREESSASAAAEPSKPKRVQGRRKLTETSQVSQAVQKVALQPAEAEHGWHSWFWDHGLRLLLWERRTGGALIGLELDPYRLMADVAGALPDTRTDDAADTSRHTMLRDARGAVIYRWGGHEPGPEAKPLRARSLPAPLHAWQLQAYVAPEVAATFEAGGLSFAVTAGVVAVLLSIAVLALFLYRENTRAAREAQQRVTFVNRVSHELKTPLTNIRMYSELLGESLEGADERASRYLGVVNGECLRLGRLIENVLSLAREERGTLQLRPAPDNVDRVVRRTLDAFEPAFAAKSVTVTFDGAMGEVEVIVDSDALRQILDNLLSNAEKYAGAGAQVAVSTRWREGLTEIRVRDSGPGVDARRAAEIFEPFVRLSDALNEGSSGTGIGLAISRELARRHGGDLLLESPASSGDASAGATFVLTLRTELATTRNAE